MNIINIHIGKQIKARRKALKLSQKKLGELIGVSFQQIQKYENGINKILASNLYILSLHMKVPISFFFDSLNFDYTTEEQILNGKLSDNFYFPPYEYVKNDMNENQSNFFLKAIRILIT